VGSVHVNGDVAQAGGRYARTGTWADGKRLDPERGSFTCTLKREGGGWKIDAMKVSRG
jgi:ketosteroid isomerase-like protein